MLTYSELRKNESVKAYIAGADRSLAALGFTEHSFAHVTKVADTCAEILSVMGYSAHETELAKIAAYLHDIGNLVNRIDHSQSGAVMAFRILDKLNMEASDIATVVSAALILADKSDVRRSRVRNRDKASFDIHDRVNYSVRKSSLKISEDKKTITLKLDIDTRYGSIMEYFEIFMQRMILCRKAAEKLGLTFKLEINGQPLL